MKNKILSIVLLIALVVVSTGLVISFLNLKNANNQIVELKTAIDEKQNNVSDEKIEKNDNKIKEFALDSNKEDIKFLPDNQKIRWYREEIGYSGLKAVVTDNQISFFLTEQGIREAYTGNQNVTLFDNLVAKIEGADIVQAKFVQLGGREAAVLIVVLSDGTVQYASVNSIIENNFSFQTIPNLSDVVSVRGVAINIAENKVQDSAIVIKRDGTKELMNNYFNF